MTPAKLLGASLVRKEDTAFLTGQAHYTDDLSHPGECYAVFVRSPHPHAHILAIDTDEASAMPGVLAVVTGQHLAQAGIGPIPSLTQTPGAEVVNADGTLAPDLSQPSLAIDKVRYAGEPVVMVVAQSVAAAQDGAEAILIDYQPLAATMEPALDPGPDTVWSQAADNRTLVWAGGDQAAVDRAFSAAHTRVAADLINNRVVIAFMEPRAAIASFDANTGRYTLEAGSQGSHGVRAGLAGMMGLAIEDLRVITPATGGGFGARSPVYPEYAPLLYAAKQLGRAIKWTATRSEAFLTDLQSRDHRLRAELALDEQGRFTAMRVQVDWRHGAYIVPRNLLVAIGFLPPTLGGVYALPQCDVAITGYVSNTTPQGAYRGIGRVESNYVTESLVHAAAAATGIDEATLRQRNLITEFPWTTPGGSVYTSGTFQDNLTRAMTLAARDNFSERRADSEKRGLLRGFGIAMFIENDGGAPTEYAQIKAHADGTVQVFAGTQDFGMGHQTVFSQVIADRLEVPYESIEVIEGDTDTVAQGSGSHGSRSTRIGGSAVEHGAIALLEKSRQKAADMLEAASADLEYAAGCFRVAGTDRTVTLAQIAERLESEGDALEGEHTFVTTAPAHSNGCQVCEVEVDPETGKVTIAQHVIVMDAGIILNPLIVTGQMHGGLAQGIGQALLEQICYAPESGQTLSGSFMDYAIPRADDLPAFTTDFVEVREADNPLGVKGAGEGPTSGSPAAFMNALRDAVGYPAAAAIDMPATPERVWRALQGGRPITITHRGSEIT